MLLQGHDKHGGSATIASIRKAWNKVTQLFPFLMVHIHGEVYSSCLRSCMLDGSETWPVFVCLGSNVDHVT